MLVFECDSCKITEKAEIQSSVYYTNYVVPDNWKTIEKKHFCKKCWKTIFKAAGVDF